MAVAFRSVATTQDPGPFGTDSTPTVTKPAGTVANDILLFVVAFDFDSTSGGSITWPSGFTQLFHQINDGPASGEDMRLACAWKLAGGSEPTDYTVTLPGCDGGSESAILCYSGCDATTPINVSGVNNDDNAGSPEDVTANSVTTTVANCMVVAMFSSFGNNPGAPFWAPPAGFTERVDMGMTTGNTALEVADEIQAAAGASGAKIAVANRAIANCAALVALAPGAGGVTIGWIRA